MHFKLRTAEDICCKLVINVQGQLYVNLTGYAAFDIESMVALYLMLPYVDTDNQVSLDLYGQLTHNI